MDNGDKNSGSGEKEKNKEDNSPQNEPPKSETPSPIPPEIMAEIPEEIRPKLKKSITTFMAEFGAYRIPIPNPLLDKITESHITTIINQAENDNVRQDRAGASTRRYVFAAFAIVLAIALALIIFLVMRNSTSVLYDLIIAVFSFAGGFGGGFGLSKHLQK
jgi:hypothetical protein